MQTEQQQANSRFKFRVWFPGINLMGLVTNLKGSNDGFLFDGVVAECWPNGKQQFYEAYKNFTLMQYTGLRDKTGKEIYESDLIDLEGKFLYVVKYEDAKFVCYHANKPDWGKWGDLCRLFDSDFLNYDHKVVGNLYENPELLK